jgi:hypothetical protein
MYKPIKKKILELIECSLEWLRCAAAWIENLMLCYRRYAAMPLGNSSGWVRATLEMANLDVTFNAFALGLIAFFLVALYSSRYENQLSQSAQHFSNTRHFLA